MGAIPKTRISRSRQARKRAHYLRLKMPHMIHCPNPECGSLRLAHTVCPQCGTYKGKQILAVNDDLLDE